MCLFLARAASSLLSLLPFRTPFPSCCLLRLLPSLSSCFAGWPPSVFFVVLRVLLCCLLPLFLVVCCLFWCFCLVFGLVFPVFQVVFCLFCCCGVSVGQAGAPVSSKACAHGSFSPFADQKLSGWLTRREWCFFWISWLTQWCCYAAMHCRYFAETKTLWEHLNSPAATTQVLRPRDSACFGEEFTGMASMSFDITMTC